MPEINIVYEPVEASWGVDVGEAGAVPPIPIEYIIIGAVGVVGLLAFFLLSKKKKH